MKFSKIILVFIILSISLKVSSQVKVADKLFEKFNYSKAASLYKKALSSKDDSIRKHATVRTADCYRLMNRLENASYWYQKASEFSDIDPVNYYYLAEALRTQSNYAEAEKFFLKYAKLKPDDKRAKVYAAYCREIEDWSDSQKSADIKNAEELNTVFSDFAPVFYKEGLVFTSDRDLDMIDNNKYHWTGNSYLDLYYSTPKTEGDFWGGLRESTKMPSIFNTPYHDGPICFTKEYKECYLTRTLKRKTVTSEEDIYTNKLKIFHAKLNKKKPEFTAFEYNSDDFSVGHPAISPDGKKMIFSSDMSGGFGESDLFLTELIDEHWSKPVNLGNVVNSFGNEVFPFWRNDSTLFFASDGHVGYGGLDLFETIRNANTWTVPRNLKSPINSSYDDFSIVFHPAKNEGFFSSNRPNGKGSDDIYLFQSYVDIPDKYFQETIEIVGVVKDKSSMQPLQNAVVFICQEADKRVLVKETSQNGSFSAELKKGGSYHIKAVQESYFDDCLSMEIKADEEENNINIYRDLLLERYEKDQLIELPNIYYDLNKWNLRPDALVVIDELVEILKENPISIEIGSHTDSRASNTYNEMLSKKRAESVLKYLIENGIEEHRLKAKGYGETQPIFDCNKIEDCTEEEHQINRRTEFRITEIFKPKEQSQIQYKEGEILLISDFEEGFFEDCSNTIDGL